ncbi:alpha-1,3-mannosyl-glycoprotein 2-beta-N-acetylglucosaminyltransferase [Acrasis kona]|uniref:Alpha-1,3-mannosyl-glycoprotein 2-beta-N-acetylglucosaminyltransferase n=1 Tax=Acrasis kona TaxID=1008807 RepID=A0AAW2ZFL9_9EUKA
MWSVGCILSEMMTRKVMFPGKSPVNQIETIIYKLGTPSKEEVRGSNNGRQFVAKMDFKEKMDFEKEYKGHDSQAVDLLKKMLTIDPDKRISAEEAMRHPYFAQIFDPEDTTRADNVFEFGYENNMKTIEDIKQETFKVILQYNGLLNRRRSSIFMGPDHSAYLHKRRPSVFEMDVKMRLMERIVELEKDNQLEQDRKTSLLQRVGNFFSYSNGGVPVESDDEAFNMV